MPPANPSRAIRKILVANRGEIAVRVIRACREMGIETVAVYSESDRAALHVRYADEAYAIGPNTPAESYLCIDKLIDVATRAGADAVHPGYGFLAENAEFARCCIDGGLTFIGPSADAMESMGSKTGARQVATAAGVRVVPGTQAPLAPEVSDAEIARVAADLGYPVLIKAVAGGGGKGMRVAAGPEDLASAIRAARSEAASSFGDPAIYLERRLARPRHIEVQLLGDSHGTIVPFVERECSIQRRHQKVVEESPSMAVSPEVRHALASAAVAVAQAVGYTNAGTIEFLLDEDGRFYFLEMNTRLQVEHPITELVTGIDLVQWQIRIAQGERLTPTPDRTLSPNGHAIECRIYAEDPDNYFLPSPGRLLGLRVPAGPGIRRDDGGVAPGQDVTVFYDPLIAKLSVWGEDRAQAIARMARALGEYEVRGIKTSIPFFRWLLADPSFSEGRFDTTTLDDLLQTRAGHPFLELSESCEEVALVAAALHAFDRAHRGPATGAAHTGAPRSLWKERGRIESLR
ncbi:MAG: acetyl/propionyl/methylcrotonyl-CoA carboxylase subunit alpha [Bacteroidales bacterium]